MKVIILRDHPQHLAFPINKIDWILWREEEEMGSTICVGTGMTSHSIKVETIDKGKALYDEIISLIQNN